MNNETSNIRIAVVDSGVCRTHSVFSGINFESGIHLYYDDNGVIQHDNITEDICGHGTAVTGLITRDYPGGTIIPVRIFDDNEADEELLIFSLEYILRYIPCDIINLSLGITRCVEIDKFEAICDQLYERGTILVSAYDNSGAISYPAAFDSVIGVDGTARKKQNYGKFYTTDSYVDVVLPLREQRAPWKTTSFEIVSGNSFLTPEVTAFVAKYLEKGICPKEIRSELRKDAAGTFHYIPFNHSTLNFSIKKAILFPFNKEMHALARFRDLLSFEIEGIYDSRFTLKPGHSIQEFGKFDEGDTIGDVSSIPWESDFDTVILGHTSLYQDVTGVNYMTWMIDQCQKWGKQLYSFSRLPVDSDSVYFPYVAAPEKPYLNKLHVITTPILTVIGTESQQGKFTLQLGLRRALQSRGVSVSHLGTEPTAELFGCDAVYPMGYDAAIDCTGYDSIYCINQFLHELDQKHADIILAGSQSHTVPYTIGGPGNYPVVQTEFLYAMQSDAYILTVSMDSDIDYIARTISFAESIYGSKVIALAVFPLSMKDRWSTIGRRTQQIESGKLREFSQILHQQFQIPTVIMEDDTAFEKLADICICYFTEE